MVVQRDPAPTMNSTLDINSLFENELQACNEDLRRQAAQTMFYKLHPTNKITVEQFFADLKQHRDVWAVVSTMGIVAFADAIVGDKASSKAAASDKPARRTRLSETQKNSIKAAIRKFLSDSKEGFSRSEIAQCIPSDQLAAIGVSLDELANKLRQPLGELVSDGTIHTVGEKRLMKYWAGSGPRKKS
jgi:hypothetical protein